MKKTIFLNFSLVVLWLSLLFIPNAEALAMFKETHTYFVERDAPENVVQDIKDYPYHVPSAHKFTFKSYQGNFYSITLGYPQEERKENEWKVVSSLTFEPSEQGQEYVAFNYVVKHWALLDERGELLKSTVTRGIHFDNKDLLDIKDILNKEVKYEDPTGFGQSFYFYYDIPKHVKEPTLEFEVELTSPQGEKITVKDSIPLKRATFKTDFFEGLLH